jgi:hypothetical protein
MITSDLEKIKAILDRGIENFDAGKPFPEDVLTQGIFDTLNQIAEVDPMVSDLMHQLMDHETSSSCDDLPFTDAEFNEATRNWMESMQSLVVTHLNKVA